MTSFLPGQLTFFISTQTSRKKSRVVGHHSRIGFILFPLARSYGRGGGIRTPNLRFWRPPLYQLELHPYWLFFAAPRRGRTGANGRSAPAHGSKASLRLD